MTKLPAKPKFATLFTQLRLELIMLPFKAISILSSTVSILSILAIPMWILGVPGVQNEFARGWKMGLGVLLSYPPACALTYLPYLVMGRRLDPQTRETWQNCTSAVALIVFLVAAARMFEAWRIMLSKSAP